MRVQVPPSAPNNCRKRVAAESGRLRGDRWVTAENGLLKCTGRVPGHDYPREASGYYHGEDNAVADIKLIVEEAPACICFTEDQFQKVWVENGISKNQISYKMQEAGLVETPKRKYAGKHRKFYLREGHELDRRSGQRSKLICRADPSESKFLEEDTGYLNSIGSLVEPLGSF